MRPNRQSHIFEHGARMTEEEKTQRARRRQRIAHMNAIIKAGGSVTVEVLSKDGSEGEDDTVSLAAISIAPYGEYKVKVYHIPFTDTEKEKIDQGLTYTVVSLTSHFFEVSI